MAAGDDGAARVHRALDDIVGTKNFGRTRNPIAWNNRIAKNKYEVIDLLRRAAKAIRNA